jgi:hypothetical protein
MQGVDDDRLKLYATFRDYAKHEDDLINQRLSWNLSIQGFLFGSYAFAFQKTAELWTKISDIHLTKLTKPTDPVTPQVQQALDFLGHSLTSLHLFLLVLTVVGAWVSVAVLKSTNAALLALNELNDRWKQADQKVSAGASPSTIALPGLLGAGRAEAHGGGLSAARLLPKVLVAGWIAVGSLDLWWLVQIRTWLF